MKVTLQENIRISPKEIAKGKQGDKRSINCIRLKNERDISGSEMEISQYYEREKSPLAEQNGLLVDEDLQLCRGR